MRSLGWLFAGMLVTASFACGPRSNEVDRFEQLPSGSSSSATNGSGGTSTTVTTGSGGAGGTSSSSGSSSLHTGSGGGTTSSSATTSSGQGGGNPGGACCAPQTSGGCPGDSNLESCVCGVDNYCCQTAWDALCVWHAQNSCQACQSAPCYDIGPEPNETEQNAHVLSAQPISDCDSAGGTFHGTIDGPGDVDWYSYEAEDTALCTVNPTRTLTTLEGPLRLCKFAECKTGNTEVTCPASATAETSPDGHPGCCAATGFTFDDLNCTGTLSEDVTITVRLDQPGSMGSVCNHYAVSYHF